MQGGPMPSQRQLDLIELAAGVTSSDKRLLAASIAGSFANGIADEYADIDLHILVEDQDLDAMRTAWMELAASIAPMVVVRPIGGVVGGFGITPDWVHLDVVCYPLSKLDPAGMRGCLPLFDRTGLLPATHTPGPDLLGEQYFPAGAVEFYFYLLGNLAVVLGRGELTLATNGAIMRRDTGLVPIMLAENGIQKTDGNKRLNPYLTTEQRAFLDALPPLSADRDAVIAFDRLVASEVIRRGRALAAGTGERWPAEFQEATLAYLRRELGMEVEV
jgi:hypothetical protein